MLVLRYFVFVGGTLVALLFVCDAVLPKPPATDENVASADDVPPIRIHSDRKWPERIVFDTNAPRPVAIAKADPPMEQPVVAAASAEARVREAFAQLPPDKPKQAVAEVKKPEPKVVRKRRLARARIAPGPRPQMMLVAQQPQPHFGFFTW